MNEKNKMRGFIVSDELWELFKNECEKQMTIPSRVIRKAIKEYTFNGKEMKKN